MRALSKLFLAVLVLAVAFSTGLAPAHAGEGRARAQVALNRLGCSSGVPDGVLDQRVAAAVVRFQSANGLPQHSRLDLRTRTRLFSQRARSCVNRPVPPRSGQGRRIVISQRQNWVWLVRHDGTVAAQSGMIDNDYLRHQTTYTGPRCGRPGKTMNNTDESGRLWLYYFTRFAECKVGFHQIPVYRSTGRQIHPDWMVGTDFRESHGCIRLPRPFARKLWDFTGPRTKVVVGP